tara:strand:- start:732 stop:1208 length:477 start_codon:yes stop_codon:yes gene_type:complete
MWQAVAAIGAGVSLLGSMSAAKSVSAAGRYKQQIANRNANVADQKADLAIFRSEQDIVKFRSQYDSILGDQTVQFNKANIMTGTGTALELAMSSAEEMDADIANMEYNAKAQASDLQDQAAGLRLGGTLARFEAKSRAKAMRIAAVGKAIGSGANIYG